MSSQSQTPPLGWCGANIHFFHKGEVPPSTSKWCIRPLLRCRYQVGKQSRSEPSLPTSMLHEKRAAAHGGAIRRWRSWSLESGAPRESFFLATQVVEVEGRKPTRRRPSANRKVWVLYYPTASTTWDGPSYPKMYLFIFYFHGSFVFISVYFVLFVLLSLIILLRSDLFVADV